MKLCVCSIFEIDDRLVELDALDGFDDVVAAVVGEHRHAADALTTRGMKGSAFT